MSKRTRIHPVQFYLNDDEQYILEEKYRLSRMKSKSANSGSSDHAFR